MLFAIGLIITILLIPGVLWLRSRWAIDSFNSYGVYGTMAGLYLYKKYGLWYIGTNQDESKLADRKISEPGSIMVGERELQAGYVR